MNLNRTFDYQSIAQFAFTAICAIVTGLLLAWLAPLLGGTKYILVGVIGLSIGFMIVGMVTRFRYLHAWSLILLIWTMPMDASIPIGESIQYAGSARLEIYLVDFAILSNLIILWLSDRNKWKTQERDPLLRWAILSFFGLLILSLMQANSLLNGIYKLIVFGRAFLLFYLVQFLVNSRQKSIYLLRLMIGLLLFQGVWAISQWWNQGAIGGEYLRYLGENNPTQTWIEWFAYHGVPIELFGRSFGIYVSGLLGSAYRLAIFLELLLPVVLVHILYGKGKYINPTIAFLSFTCGSVALLLTANRSAWFSAMFGAMMVFMLGGWKYSSWRTFDRLLLLMLFVIVVSLAFDELVLTRLIGTNLDASLDKRELYISEAMSMIRLNVFSGVGIGNYGTQFGVSNIVHNVYLVMWAEVGILAVLLFVYLVFRILRQGLGISWRSEDEMLSLTSLGIVSGSVSCLIHGLFDWVLLRPNVFVLFWGMLGILVALSKMEYRYHAE